MSKFLSNRLPNRYFSCLIFCAQTLDLKSLISLSYVSTYTQAVTDNDMSWINSEFVTADFKDYFCTLRFATKSYKLMLGTHLPIADTHNLLTPFFTPTQLSAVDSQVEATERFFQKISRIRGIIYSYDCNSILTSDIILKFNFPKLKYLTINCHNKNIYGYCKNDVVNARLLQPKISTLKKLVIVDTSVSTLYHPKISFDNSNLEYLSLDCNNIAYKLESIQFHKLHSLHLTYMRDQATVKKFLNAMYTCHTVNTPCLTSLNLSHIFCNAVEDNITSCRGTALQSPSTCPEGKGSKRQGKNNFDMLTKCLAQLTTLRELNLAHSTLDDDGFDNLSDSLTHIPNLNVIDLEKFFFRPKKNSMCNFFRLIPNIEVIRMDLTYYIVYVDMEFVSVLKQMTKVKELDLNGATFVFERKHIEIEFYTWLKGSTALEKFDIGADNEDNIKVARYIFGTPTISTLTTKENDKLIKIFSNAYKYRNHRSSEKRNSQLVQFTFKFPDNKKHKQ